MTNRLRETKERIRKHHAAFRMKLDSEEVGRKSSLICKKVVESPEFLNAKLIHTYISMTQNNEVDTTDLILKLLESQKRIAVPKMTENGELDHILLQSMKQLKINSWGAKYVSMSFH